MTESIPTSAQQPTLRKCTGGCHCGAVRYEVELDLSAAFGKCNCSMCTKSSFWGAIAKPAAFKLVSGEDALSDYQFGSNSVHHLFCKHCGVRSFGRGNLAALGGEYYSINVCCLDGVDFSTLTTQYWDGRNNNWQAGPRPQPYPGGAA
jgi:hypothetical protein